MAQQEARQGIVRVGEVPSELDEYKRAQLAEYTQWVASQDIYAGTALAFRKGDPVPASTVKAQGFDKNGLVEPAGDRWTQVDDAAAVAAKPAKSDK